jgi:preprotein translocase subunit SecD
MKINRAAINFYLTGIGLLALTLMIGGCKSMGKQRKETVTLRLYLETPGEQADPVTKVPIFRAHPVYIAIDRTPFLDENMVSHAEVVEDRAGFALRIDFNSHGKLVLETVSGTNPGRRIAVKSVFNGELRWLGAPVISRHLSSGSLTFTPDATREEIETITKGLNKLAHHLENDKELK